jgi:5-formyltetrahydrofolate cyclo-ligase
MPPPTDPSIAADKKELRALLRARRADAAAADPDASARVAATFEAEGPRLPAGAVVAGYVAKGDELDPLPLLKQLGAAGHPLCLPRVADRNGPLVFHGWSAGAALEEGAFGILEPPASAPVVRPAVLMMPLLGFDRRGTRLGYGGGFYDRSLAALADGAISRGPGAPLTVGLAFAAQEWETLPREAHDAPLDWVVTERAALRFAAR